MPEVREGFANSYRIELLFGQPPGISPVSIGQELRGLPFEFAPEVRGSYLHLTVGMPGDPDASTVLIGLRPGTANRDAVARAAAQSFSWTGARNAAALATHSVELADAGAADLPYRDRIERFQSILAPVVAVTRPLAIHWMPSGQLVDPDAFLGAVGHEGPMTTLGSINVRMFRIDSYDDGSPLPEPEIVMDTLGLAAIGLDDFQCHFVGLPVDAVGHHLHAIACYAFERGPVIRGGDEIAGLEHGSRWRCEFENAIIGPPRVVVDVDPGPPWSAGPRGLSRSRDGSRP